MHFTSTSTIPLALALLLTSSSLLSVSATPDSVSIVQPYEQNNERIDCAALTGSTLDEGKAPRRKRANRYEARDYTPTLAPTDSNDIESTDTPDGMGLSPTTPREGDPDFPPVGGLDTQASTKREQVNNLEYNELAGGNGEFGKLATGKRDEPVKAGTKSEKQRNYESLNG